MSQMTSKERLLAAIRFEGPDRVPVSPRFWRYLLKHEGTQKQPAHLKYAEIYGMDLLFGAAAGPVQFIPQPGADYSRLGPDIRVDEQRETRGDYTISRRTFETPAGTLTEEKHMPKPGNEFGIAPNAHIEEHIVKGPDDLAALELLIQAWAAAHEVPDYRKLSAEIGDRGLLSAHTYSALSHNAGDAYPLEELMIACYENPQFVDQLMDLFHNLLMDIMRRALENGAEVVFCSTFFESMSSGWSPKLYRRFFLPRIKDHVDLAHEYGVPYHLYDDGKVAQTLPMLREVGIDLLSTVCPPPSGDVTPAKARELAGRDVCLNGGIDTVNTIWRGTPETIDAAVKEAIEQAALPEGGYIVGTSDSITEEAPVENFRALFEAVRKYGTLPSR
jgi:uroporphyrinogen-III decarboxylase